MAYQFGNTRKQRAQVKHSILSQPQVLQVWLWQWNENFPMLRTLVRVKASLTLVSCKEGVGRLLAPPSLPWWWSTGVTPPSLDKCSDNDDHNVDTSSLGKMRVQIMDHGADIAAAPARKWIVTCGPRHGRGWGGSDTDKFSPPGLATCACSMFQNKRELTWLRECCKGL